MAEQCNSRTLRSRSDAQEVEEFSTPAKTAVENSTSRNTYSKLNHKNLVKVLDTMEKLIKDNELLYSKMSDLEKKISSCKCRNESVDSGKEKIVQIHELLSLEKQNRKFEDQCKSIKNQIAVFWSRNLSQRKKSFWHYCMNSSKANMYSQWIEDYPDYIPLKFKPKRIPNENQDATSHRVNKAREDYRSSVDLHKAYAASHEQKFKAVDSAVLGHIEKVTSLPEEQRILKEWWSDDTARCEHQSFQIWSKKENFFNRKRTEDIENDRSIFSKQTWDEITNSRRTPHRHQNRNNYQKNFRQNNNNRRDIQSRQSNYQQNNGYNNGNNTTKSRSRTRSQSPQHFRREQNQPQPRTNHHSPRRNVSPTPEAQQNQRTHDNRTPRYNATDYNPSSPRFLRHSPQVSTPLFNQVPLPATTYNSLPNQPDMNFPWYPMQRVWM